MEWLNQFTATEQEKLKIAVNSMAAIIKVISFTISHAPTVNIAAVGRIGQLLR